MSNHMSDQITPEEAKAHVAAQQAEFDRQEPTFDLIISRFVEWADERYPGWNSKEQS